MPAPSKTVKPQQPAKQPGAVPDASSYDEERVPFDQVLRRLVNTPPAHKTAGPVKRNAKKPPKKV